MSKLPSKTTASDKEPSLRGAPAALLGFDYQLDVSILAALQLLLVSKAAERLILEPNNDEDIEADLAEIVPGAVQPSAAMAGGYKLVVQVKHRTIEPWSIEDFNKLLKHGSDLPGGRRKALHHLDDPDTRYLLVTSADAKGVARHLLVEGFEEASDKASFPKSLRGTLKKSPEGRVAIWGKLTPQQLKSTIREKFSDVLHVPKVQQENLLQELRREAAERMRKLVPGVWSRDDLLGTVQKFGGFLSSSSSLEQYVPPQNYDDMTGKLAKFGAVVLRGPSGTGKTETARKLCDWALDRDGTLELVTLGAADMPSAALKLVNNGPTLFYLDDPWGQYSLSGGAEAWTEQLPYLLRNAHAGHQFIVTSRADMMESGDVKDTLNSWTIRLDPEHYADGQLGDIYDRRISGLTPALQSQAYGFRATILDRLKTPLEIDIYFQHLQRGPEEKETGPAFLQRLLNLAHREAVADVIVKTLKSQDRTGSGAVIWAVLGARGQMDRTQMVATQRAIRTADRELSDSLDKLADRMIAAQFLRQPARTIFFAHPSAKEGFEAHAKANWPRSEAAAATLVSGLTQLPAGHSQWGIETAARVYQLTRDVAERLDADLPFEIDPQSQKAIDTWLDESLVAKASDFMPLLELASEVGSDESIGSRVAHWLLKGVKRGAAWFTENWEPPEYDDAWYEVVSEHPLAVRVADRFVREVLAFDRGSYDGGFVTSLDRIASDLTPAYIAAALTMVGNGFETNAGTVAAGASRDLAAFETVVDAALDDLAKDWRRWVETEREEMRAIEDGERDAAAEEAMRWQHEGDGYTSGVFVGAYIRGLRRAGRWSDVAGHGRVSELVRSWSNAVLTSGPPAGLDELRALLAAAKGNKDETDAWGAARQHWHEGLADDLGARLREPVDSADLRDELVLCGLAHEPACLPSAFDQLAAEPHRQIILLADMHRVAGRLGEDEAKTSHDLAITHLPPALQDISAAMPTKARAAKAVGADALALLTAEAGRLDPDTLTHVVPVIIASGGDASASIRHWLEIATKQDHARSAAEAAIAIDDAALVALALQHARADARVTALNHLAAPLAAPLPPDLLGFAKDPSNRVRSALVSLLHEKPHSEHIGTLAALTADSWSSAEPEHEQSDSYDVAREAVAALKAYGALSDDIGKELLHRADVTSDRTLSQNALIAAAKCCSAAVQHDIWNLVNLPVSRWIRVDALAALAHAEAVDAAIMAEVTARYIFASPAILAVPASVLIARHAAYATVQQIFGEIASANAWRALLLVGATSLASRDEAEAKMILDLLAPDHPARQLLEPGDPLPSNIMDDLGDVRVREHVRKRLGDRIASDKKRV